MQLFFLFLFLGRGGGQHLEMNKNVKIPAFLPLKAPHKMAKWRFVCTRTSPLSVLGHSFLAALPLCYSKCLRLLERR